MSRILKRPMFKRGGQSNDGIMSNVVDRKQYALGSIDEEKLRSDAAAITGVLDRFAPIPKTRLPLGEVGFLLASGADPIDALGAGYSKFVKADDATQAARAKRRGAAVSTALSSQLKKPEVPKLKFVKNTSDQTLFNIKPGETGFVTNKEILAARGVFSEVKDTTTKAVKNISNEELFGIPPGGESFATNAQILASQGKLKEPDKRMITLPDGRVLPYEEYKKQNTDESKARALGTQYSILTGFVDDMKSRLPDTKTFAVGQGFAFVEGLSDQFSQIAESIGNKSDLDLDDDKFNTYMENKGFTKFASNFATMKGSVINLGYALAKIAEPDNPRLSEGDIIRQLNRINFGSSRKVFSDSLDQILKEEGIRARAEIKGLGFKDADKFFNLEADEVTKKTESELGVEIPEYKFINGVLHIKKGNKFEPVKAK
tara:strand:+ start:144 stop:1433 length:1290 start_codon:yes stop_codon:yes gene_type:complete